MKNNRVILTTAAACAIMLVSGSAAAEENWQEGMIADQSFEVTLSEYSGKVWFAAYPPSDSMDVILKIVQDKETLETLATYTPEFVSAYSFTSLDAVSFVDYNGDGNTDILIIKTFGDQTVPVIYEGTPDQEEKFTLKAELSVRAKQQAEKMTIAGVQAYLAFADAEIGSPAAALPDGIPGNFVFASGVGAWGTSLTLNADGSFSGSYSDTDMIGGDGYEATRYYSDFSGSFDDIRQVSEHVYFLHVAQLQLADEPGTQSISDNCLNLATNPYGMKANGDYYLYLPGAETSELPIVPASNWSGIEYSGTTLTSWVLYNIADADPFGGFE